MIRKIIQIADIHIPNSENNRPYREMLETFLAELYGVIKDCDKDEVRIVIVGDIFEHKVRTSNEAKTLFHIMLNYLNAIGNVIIVAGNHDLLENNHNKKDSISPTFEITNVYENITYLDKELDYTSGAVVDDNVIWVLYSIFDKFKHPDIEKLKEQHPDKKIIGLYHGDVAGAVTDIGHQRENGIDTTVFSECDCVMAGHIHRHQELKREGVPIVYSGSLFQKDAGENVTGHGFVVWDTTDMSYKLYEVNNSYRIFKFKISSYEDVHENNEILINY